VFTLLVPWAPTGAAADPGPVDQSSAVISSDVPPPLSPISSR
jgi:hypothetical protein